MTPDKTPTPDELEAFRDAFDWDGWTDPKAAQRAFGLAVLAKWGSPVVAVEPGTPDFYTACGRHEDGRIALPAYSNATEQGVMALVLEGARREGYKGTAADRLLELGWAIRPVYLTPQPTQAQAGAVPQYRLLQSGVDRIEAADEFLSDDTTTWAIDPKGIFVGNIYGGHVLRPARRLIKEGGQHGRII